MTEEPARWGSGYPRAPQSAHLRFESEASPPHTCAATGTCLEREGSHLDEPLLLPRDARPAGHDRGRARPRVVGNPRVGAAHGEWARALVCLARLRSRDPPGGEREATADGRAVGRSSRHRVRLTGAPLQAPIARPPLAARSCEWEDGDQLATSAVTAGGAVGCSVSDCMLPFDWRVLREIGCRDPCPWGRGERDGRKGLRERTRS